MTDAIPLTWLKNREQKANSDIYYCKGDAKRNVEIAYAIKIVRELWGSEQETQNGKD